MHHPKAIIDPKAKLDNGVSIGPYCVIGPQVKIGSGTILESHVILKGNTKIGKNNKFGSYYYIIRFKPKSAFDPVTHGIVGSRDPSHAGVYITVHIAFYDQKGFSLYSSANGNTLSPGWHNKYDELNRIDGGWEWKGQFDEESITVENFRNIHSVKVKYGEKYN